MFRKIEMYALVSNNFRRNHSSFPVSEEIAAN